MNLKPFVILLLFLIPAVLADNLQPGQTDVMAAAIANAQCRDTFTAGYLNAISQAAPSAANLAADVTKLQLDITQLQTLQGQANQQAFNSQMHTFDNDLHTASQDAHSAFKAANFTADQKSTLNATYASLKATLDTCTFQTQKQYELARVNAYELQLEAALAKANSINGSADLITLINKANSTIVQPLIAAINAANDPASLRAAGQQYCLHDDCQNGTNFHFDAQFATLRLGMFVSQLSSRGNSTNNPFLPQLEAAFNSAHQKLDDMGDRHDPESLEQLQQMLHNTSLEAQQANREEHNQDFINRANEAISRLQGLLSQMQSSPEASNASTELAAAQQDITDATGIITAGNFSQDTRNQLQSYLKDANEALQQARQIIMQNRQQGQRGNGTREFPGNMTRPGNGSRMFPENRTRTFPGNGTERMPPGNFSGRRGGIGQPNNPGNGEPTEVPGQGPAQPEGTPVAVSN